jgi:hypothetical protein
LIAAGSLAACLAISAHAVPHAEAPGAVAEVPMLDPWVPPAAREKALGSPMPEATRGAALQAQVERKLRARFEAAAGPEGMLTREQARAAGLGFIAQHFSAIDRQGDGRVSFPEYLDYLRSR